MKDDIREDLDEIWEQFCCVEAPAIPFDAIAKLIGYVQKCPDVEAEVLEAFERDIEDPDEEWDDDFYWTMISLGAAGCEPAIPLFLRCLQRFPEYDFVLEVAAQCLIWLGEPALREIMRWMRCDNPGWVERLYASGVFEAVLEYGDANLIDEAKHFIKEQVVIDETSDDAHSCFDVLLGCLAFFPGDDVLPFVRDIVRKYEFNPELNEAFEIADGRLRISGEKRYARSWEDFASHVATLLNQNDERERERQRAAKRLLLEKMETFFQKEQWDEIVALKNDFSEEELLRGMVLLPIFFAFRKQKREKELYPIIKIAWEKSQKDWEEIPAAMNYERDVEPIEVINYMIEENDKKTLECMLALYAYRMHGMLRPVGCAKLDEAIEHLKRVSGFFNFEIVCSDEDLRTFFVLQKEWFVVSGDSIALPEVTDSNAIFRERKQRCLSVLFPETLQEVLLWHEGREDVLYTIDECALDQDIRILTRGVWSLQQFREEMQNDIGHSNGRERLEKKLLLFQQEYEELCDCVWAAWRMSPRWELGGISFDKVHVSERDAHVLPKYQKVGRNDPCPCGSGKKYKKCCL